MSEVSGNISRANISNLSSDFYSSPFPQAGLRYSCTVYQSEILRTSCIAYLQQQLSLSLSQAETYSQQRVCPSPRLKLGLYSEIHNSESVSLSLKRKLGLYPALITNSLSLPAQGCRCYLLALSASSIEAMIRWRDLRLRWSTELIKASSCLLVYS